MFRYGLSFGLAGTVNYDRLRVMKKSIEDGGGKWLLSPLKIVGPLFEGFVRGKDDGTAFVSLADDLENQVSSPLIYGQVGALVQNKQSRREIAFELGFERAREPGRHSRY
jgi:hypothetical protein